MYQLIACGVNRADGQAELAFSEKDAQDVATLFGSAVGPPLLTGTLLVGDDATHASLLDAFLAASVSSPDYLVFYFSGHGDERGVALKDDLLSYETLASLVRLVDARATFIILDTCSAASAQQFFKEARVGGVGNVDESWLAALASAQPGTRLIFSTGPARPAGESAAYGNGIFTHFFIRVLSEATGDLRLGGTKWISDRQASFGARALMTVAGHRQVPLFFNLTGDFPMTLSQRGATIGEGHIAEVAISRQSVDVMFSLVSREGLHTTLAWEVFNCLGTPIAEGEIGAQPDASIEVYADSIPCPREALLNDPATRLASMTQGAASITWSLTLKDATGAVLDTNETRALFRIPRGYLRK